MAECLSISEVSSWANVSEETVRQFVNFGLLETYQLEGQAKQLKQQDVRDLFGLITEPPQTSQSKAEQVRLAEERDSQILEPTVESNHAEADQGFDIEIEFEDSNDQVSDRPTRENHFAGTYELVAINKRLLSEIRSLKEERDWLRSRLEKLEARIDRDQMLILTSNETIRKLAENNLSQPQHQGVFAGLLPWFRK